MQYLITRLKKWTEDQEKERKPYERTHFWASENTHCKRTMFWKWKNEPVTNPIEISSLQIMKAGSKVEDQLVEDWNKMGILVPVPKGEYDQHYISVEREGIKITGKLDAIIKETLDDGKEVETPVEVKSFYGDYQERMLLKLELNESYVKQLAIYMDALNKDRGILYMVNRGNGRQFQFTMLRKSGEYKVQRTTYIKEDPNNPDNKKEKVEFKIGFMKFDINDVYKDFAKTYEYIQNNKLPKPTYQYKYPLTLEMLKSQTASAISGARNGRKVMGDWNCLYCPYKHRCLEEEGIKLGYTDKEIEQIKSLSQGYTTKNWR